MELEYKRRLLFKLHKVRAGFSLLDIFQKRSPRDVLKTIRNYTYLKDKMRNAISKMLFIHKNIKRLRFDDWLAVTDLQSQKLRMMRIANTCFDMPVVGRLHELLIRKPIRFGFSKLQANANPRTKELLRGALLVMMHCQNDSKAKALSIWKLNSLCGKMDERITALTKRPKIADGFNKLDNLHRKHPRKALRSINKKKHHVNKVDDTMKLLALINKNRVGKLLALWKS